MQKIQSKDQPKSLWPIFIINNIYYDILGLNHFSDNYYKKYFTPIFLPKWWLTGNPSYYYTESWMG